MSTLLVPAGARPSARKAAATRSTAMIDAARMAISSRAPLGNSSCALREETSVGA